MRKSKRIRGSITVETMLFLIPFIFAFCTIVNMARFIEAEMIIHHAITQTAKEISAYGNVLTKTKITEKMQSTNKKSEDFKTDVGKTISSIEDFVGAFGSGDVTKIYGSGQTAWGNVESIASDPSAVVSGVLALAKSNFEQSLMTAVAGSLARGSINKQLSIMTDDPDDYLEKLGVVGGMDGLDFSKSRWNSNTSGRGNVKIVVTFTMKNQLFPMFDIGERDYILSADTLSW